MTISILATQPAAALEEGGQELEPPELLHTAGLHLSESTANWGTQREQKGPEAACAH